MKYHVVKTKLKNVDDDIKNRTDYIGGSDIGTIMGANPWKSPYTLWAEKTGLITPENIDDKEAVWWGREEEELVAKRFTMKTNAKVRKSNYAYSLKELPYLKGHIDRIVIGKPVGLECKTTSAFNKFDYDSGEIPPSHYYQCQFYMLVTGLKEWWLATKKDNRFYVTHIARDEDVIESIVTICEDFWNHVQSGEPVEIDGSESTGKTLAEMYPEEQEGETVNLEPQEDTLLALLEIGTQEKSLKKLKTKYQNEIKAVLGEAERGETGQFTVSWKANEKGTRVFRLMEKPV